MVHLLPMNWTDYKPGQNVQVWAYANVDTVELFLNGQSLGVQHFDHKFTTDGREYLETTECSGDDKTFTSGTFLTCASMHFRIRAGMTCEVWRSKLSHGP